MVTPYMAIDFSMEEGKTCLTRVAPLNDIAACIMLERCRADNKTTSCISRYV